MYDKLKKLLAKRGKKDFAIKIAYKAIPGRGYAPTDRSGPACLGMARTTSPPRLRRGRTTAAATASRITAMASNTAMGTNRVMANSMAISKVTGTASNKVMGTASHKVMAMAEARAMDNMVV